MHIVLLLCWHVPYVYHSRHQRTELFGWGVIRSLFLVPGRNQESAPSEGGANGAPQVSCCFSGLGMFGDKRCGSFA